MFSYLSIDEQGNEKKTNENSTNFSIVTNYVFTFLIRKHDEYLFVSPAIKKENLLLAFYFLFIIRFDECTPESNNRDDFLLFINNIRNEFEKIATEEIKSLKTKNKDSHDGDGDKRWLRSSKFRMNASQVSRIWYSATCSLFKKSGNVFIAKSHFISSNEQAPIVLKVLDTFKSYVEEQRELRNEIGIYLRYLNDNKCKLIN